MRAIARPLALAVLGWLLAASPSPAQDLRLAVVFRLVQAPNPQAMMRLHEWSQTSQLHIGVVGFDVMARHYEGRRLRLQSGTVSAVPDPAALQTWWRQQEAVYVLGAVAVARDSVTVIDSTVYMGDFRGRLPSSVFTLRQEVRSSDYDASHAVLAAITLYGLANQAAAQGRTATACALFREAAVKITGVNVQAMRAQALPGAIAASRRDHRC